MEEVTQTIALSLGAAWASGINLYAAILVLGLLGATGRLDLPPTMEVLTDPLVVFASGALYIVEFFADKIPGMDTSWDALHTFIRIPAGAMLAAGAVGDLGAGAELAAAFAGGSIAATSHAAKAGSRVLINTSPEPFTNWAASISEDIAVIAGLFAALKHPVLFLVLLVLFLIFTVWLLPRLWRAIKRTLGRLTRWLGSAQNRMPQQPSAPPGSANRANTRDVGPPGSGSD